MISTVSLRNTLASAYVAACGYTGLLSALTLQSTTTAGATTFSSDLSVVAGDTVVFGFGTGVQESRTVSAVSGSGPYTVTVAALTYGHTVNDLISHLPAAIANGHEINGGTYARVASGWGAVSAGSATTAGTAINVPAGAKVGSVAQFSASTAGNLLDSDPVTPQAFGSAGTYPAAVTYTQV